MMKGAGHADHASAHQTERNDLLRCWFVAVLQASASCSVGHRSCCAFHCTAAELRLSGGEPSGPTHHATPDPWSQIHTPYTRIKPRVLFLSLVTMQLHGINHRPSAITTRQPRPSRARSVSVVRASVAQNERISRQSITRRLGLASGFAWLIGKVSNGAAQAEPEVGVAMCSSCATWNMDGYDALAM